MSAGNIKGLKVEIDGATTGLEAALKRVGKSANDINKELSQVEKGLKFDPSNTVLIAQKQELLSDKIKETRVALDALQQAQGRVEAMYKSGEIDKGQYRAFQRELETTKSKLKTFETQVHSAGKVQDVAAEKTAAWTGKLKMGLGLALAGTIAYLGRMVTSVLDNADALEKLADKTGLTTDRLQELQYIGADLGVDLDTIAGAQAKLTKAMNAGRDGTGVQADAFAALGIAVTDGSGNLRDAKTVMMEAFEALNGVGNETERDALAMAIFGKSAQELNPLIVAGTDELNKLSQAARDSGAIMSEDAVAGLDQFGDAMDKLKLVGMARFGELFAMLAGGDFAGAFQGWWETIVKFFQKVFTWIQANGVELVDSMAKWAIGFVEWIGPMIPKFLAGLAQLLEKLWDWYKTAWPMIVAKIAEWAGAFIDWIVPMIPSLLAKLAVLLAEWYKWLYTVMLPTLVVALLKLGWELVKAIGSAIAGVFDKIKGPFVSAWDWLVGDSGPKSWPGKVWEWMNNIVARIGSALSGVWEAMTGPFRRAWNWIKTNVIDKLTGAWNAVKSMFGGGSSDSGGSTTGHALGGTFSTPHVAMFAEDGTETVLPHNNPLRALDILADSGLLDAWQGMARPSSAVSNSAVSNTYNITVDGSRMPSSDFNGLIASIQTAQRLLGATA